MPLHNNNLDLSNVDDLDESVLNAIGVMTPNSEYSSSAEGDEFDEGADYGNEDVTEPDEADELDTSDLDAEELPKFRQLIREEKLKFKAKFGKAKISMKTKKPKWCNKNWCAIKVPVRTRGWRFEWKKWKRGGGLAKLKMYAKGLSTEKPTTPAEKPTTPPILPPTPPPTAGNTTTTGGRTPRTVPTKDLNDTTQAGSTTDAAKTGGESGAGLKDAEGGDDKILGMPKGVAIGVGVALVAVVGFFAYKKFIKK